MVVTSRISLIVSGDGVPRQLIVDLISKISPPMQHIFCTRLISLIKTINEQRPEVIILFWDSAPAGEWTKYLQKIKKTSETVLIPIIVIVEKNFSSQFLAIINEYNIHKALLLENISRLNNIIEEISVNNTKSSNYKILINRIEYARVNCQYGELDAAIQDLFVLFPDEIKTNIEYANYWIRKNDWIKAEKYAKIAYAKDNKNTRALNIMARVYMHKGKFDEAIKLLNTAEELSPNNIHRLIIMGDAFIMLNNKEKALEKYKGAIVVDPESNDALQTLGKIRLSEGQINTAISLLKQSSTDEELASIFNNSAIVACRQKNYIQARELYNTAISILQNIELKAKIIFNIALSYTKEGNKEKAFTFYEKAYILDNKFVRPLLFMDTNQDEHEFYKISESKNSNKELIKIDNAKFIDNEEEDLPFIKING